MHMVNFHFLDVCSSMICLDLKPTGSTWSLVETLLNQAGDEEIGPQPGRRAGLSPLLVLRSSES